MLGQVPEVVDVEEGLHCSELRGESGILGCVSSLPGASYTMAQPAEGTCQKCGLIGRK